MRRVILTGGSDGLGESFGRLCVKNGVDVVCVSRTAPSYPATHIGTDLTDQQSIIRTVEAISRDFPIFDALINCAGVYSAQDPADVSWCELERVLRTNLIAPAFMTSRLLDQIKKNGSDILNVGSTVGTKAYPGQMAYGSSKWGVRGVSANLQLELKGTPCRVIQFNPGGFKSDLVKKFDGEESDLSAYMEADDLALLMWSILQLPKGVEVSEIIINRK